MDQHTNINCRKKTFKKLCLNILILNAFRVYLLSCLNKSTNILSFKFNNFLTLGETSAGKSSILNLLFGEDVLATHHGSCTSVITKILYHRQRRAKIVFRNGKIQRIKNIPQGGIRKCLEPYLFVKDDVSRDKTTLIKEVVIYLPAKILEVS